MTVSPSLVPWRWVANDGGHSAMRAWPSGFLLPASCFLPSLGVCDFAGWNLEPFGHQRRNGWRRQVDDGVDREVAGERTRMRS